MPSDKQPAEPKRIIMADRIRAAYKRVYGIEADDPRSQPTYEPFMEGYLACHRDGPVGVTAVEAPSDLEVEHARRIVTAARAAHELALLAAPSQDGPMWAKYKELEHAIWALSDNADARPLGVGRADDETKESRG